MTRPPGQDYISSARIRRRVRELGQSIRKFYKNRPLTIVALLKGSVFFVVDLLRHLEPSTEVEFWTVSSYRGTRSTGRLQGLHACRGNFRGRDVLLIDDILDSGLTLAHTRDHAKKLGARRVEICVLLNKKKKTRPCHHRPLGRLPHRRPLCHWLRPRHGPALPRPPLHPRSARRGLRLGRGGCPNRRF